MTLTINTDNKTIKIHGSYRFEEFAVIRRQLPLEWLDYPIESEPVYYYQNTPATSAYWLTPPYTINCGTDLGPTTTATQTRIDFN